MGCLFWIHAGSLSNACHSSWPGFYGGRDRMMVGCAYTVRLVIRGIELDGCSDASRIRVCSHGRVQLIAGRIRCADC